MKVRQVAEATDRMMMGAPMIDRAAQRAWRRQGKARCIARVRALLGSEPGREPCPHCGKMGPPMPPRAHCGRET